jgi:hypothetical protein
MSATTVVYDGLEILCALAPNMGSCLRVRDKRSITPHPLRGGKADPRGSLPS